MSSYYRSLADFTADVARAVAAYACRHGRAGRLVRGLPQTGLPHEVAALLALRAPQLLRDLPTRSTT